MLSPRFLRIQGTLTFRVRLFLFSLPLPAIRIYMYVCVRLCVCVSLYLYLSYLKSKKNMAAPGETRGRSKLFTRFYVCSSKKRRPAESYRDNRERKLFRITDERQGSFRNDFVLLLERSYTGAKLRRPPEATKVRIKFYVPSVTRTKKERLYFV